MDSLRHPSSLDVIEKLDEYGRGEGWRALGTRLPGAFLSSLYTDTRYEIFYGMQPYLTSTVYIVIDSVKTSS